MVCALLKLLSQQTTNTMLELSQYWLDRNHADVELVVVSADTESKLARIPAHCIILAAASSYFAALLSPIWHQGCSQSRAAVKLVLPASDLPAMIALLRCIYTKKVRLEPSDLQATMIAGTQSTHGSSYLSQMLSMLSSMCWQELHVRVITLADQFHVPGAIDVASSKLKSLFTYQLSWPAVEAVLWLPAPLAQQPLLTRLRLMAINCIKQDLRRLDACLASPEGRHKLQALPPDALGALLSCDELAVISENSVLAAIDVWLAGPVAHGFAQLYSNSAPEVCAAAADSTGSSMAGYSNSSSSSMGRGVTNVSGSGSISPFAEALQQLLSTVRLPLCSGAFLAAAGRNLPWLCQAMQGQSSRLQLLQRYYSSDAEGRYQLSMSLLQSGNSCPWSVPLRKPAPAALAGSKPGAGSPNSHSSTEGTSGSKTGLALGTCTRLSQLKALLTPTAASPQGLAAAGSAEKPAGYATAAAPGQVPPGLAPWQDGILVNEVILGGYWWQLQLVAIELISKTAGTDVDERHVVAVPAAAETALPTDVDGGRAAGAAAAGQAEADEQAAARQRQQQLCLKVACRPAWAASLASTNGSSGMHSTAAASSMGPALAVPGACSSSSVGAGPAHKACQVCTPLGAIAQAKAADATARHAPLIALQNHRGPSREAAEPQLGPTEAYVHSNNTPGNQAAESASLAQSSSTGNSRSSGSSSGSSSWALDVVVGVQLTAACSSTQLQHLLLEAGKQPPAVSHVSILLPWDSQASAAWGLIPLHVAGIGSTVNLIRSRLQNEAAGQLQGLQAAGAGVRLVADAVAAGGADGERAGAGGGHVRVGGSTGTVLCGWQPELWSGLAPSGEVHWSSSLRLLAD